MCFILQRNYESAVQIQANWRGYIARKKLLNASRAFGKFQKAFRYVLYCSPSKNILLFLHPKCHFKVFVQNDVLRAIE